MIVCREGGRVHPRVCTRVVHGFDSARAGTAARELWETEGTLCSCGGFERRTGRETGSHPLISTTIHVQLHGAWSLSLLLRPVPFHPLTRYIWSPAGRRRGFPLPLLLDLRGNGTDFEVVSRVSCISTAYAYLRTEWYNCWVSMSAILIKTDDGSNHPTARWEGHFSDQINAFYTFSCGIRKESLIKRTHQQIVAQLGDTTANPEN